jgi:N-carbamoylputrescine amidase
MRKVVGGLIQMSNPINDANAPVAKISKAMLDKHLPYIEEAGKKGVQILCLQESSTAPTSARARMPSGAISPSRFPARRSS